MLVATYIYECIHTGNMRQKMQIIWNEVRKARWDFSLPGLGVRAKARRNWRRGTVFLTDLGFTVIIVLRLGSQLDVLGSEQELLAVSQVHNADSGCVLRWANFCNWAIISLSLQPPLFLLSLLVSIVVDPDKTNLWVNYFCKKSTLRNI